MVEMRKSGTARPASRATASTSSTTRSARAARASCSGRGSRPTSRCSASPTAPSRWASAISFGQAVVAGLIGIVFSFLLCGFIALAGKRGSAPTMVLSRAAFGVRGNKLPAAISWLLTVGWETVLVILATLATATVFDRLGLGGGTATKVVALLVVAALVRGRGRPRLRRDHAPADGHHDRHRACSRSSSSSSRADQIDWARSSALPAGSVEQVIGALVFLMTGFGLGLGQRRRRLLALPAARRVLAAASSPGRRSARRSRRSCC